MKIVTREIKFARCGDYFEYGSRGKKDQEAVF